MLKILIVDNNDSFTYNLVEMLRQTKLCTVDVCILADFQENELSNYHGVILSPGPGLPKEKQGLFELITKLDGQKPLLGVCLGHQAIAQYFDANIYQLDKIMHGEYSSIEYKEPDVLFSNLENHLQVGRYHSWAIEKESLSKELLITSETNSGLVMSFKHCNKNIRGVQFHPESILTPKGKEILKNWLIYCVKISIN